MLNKLLLWQGSMQATGDCLSGCVWSYVWYAQCSGLDTQSAVYLESIWYEQVSWITRWCRKRRKGDGWCFVNGRIMRNTVRAPLVPLVW